MSQSKRTLPVAYHIEFDTKQFPGMLVATRITIRSDVIRDKNQKLNMALSLHPLYPKLFEYCILNPPPGVQINRRKI